MPVSPTYPGVYIEEIPSAVHTITGVSTSVAAFIDYFKRGPMNKAVQIFSMGDFIREFGGLDSMSEASYAIQQFFLNGGGEAWVVRVASGSVAQATVDIASGIDGNKALTVKALNAGSWSNNLYVSIDHQTPAPQSLFNMTVFLMEERDGRKVVVKSEVFRGLSMKAADATFVENVVNDGQMGSKLVRVTATGDALPMPNGTLSGSLESFPTLSFANPQIDVTFGEKNTATASLSGKPTTLAEARKLLESAIRAAKPADPLFAQANVLIINNRLLILAGLADVSKDANTKATLAPYINDRTADKLGLTKAIQLQGVLSSELLTTVSISAGSKLNIKIGEITKPLTFVDPKTGLAEVGAELQRVIRSADDSDAFKNALVALHTDESKSRLLVLPGISAKAITFSLSGDDNTTATKLGLIADVVSVIGFVSGVLDPNLIINRNAAVNVKIDTEEPHRAIFSTDVETLDSIAPALQAAIRTGKTKLGGVRVITDKSRLIILLDKAATTFSVTNAPDELSVTELKLESATANVQLYHLGETSATKGDDGDAPNAAALIGDEGSKTGLYALEAADLFNILCIPRVAMLKATDAAAVLAVATRYCEKRRAFFVMDTADGVDELQEIKEWLNNNATLRHQNAALYFPRVKIADPLNNARLRAVGASGTIAGLYARTDSTRGVWKAPAGTEAVLSGVQALDCKLTDAENGALNPLAINCLRNLPVYGNVSWGARTLHGSDQQASEWKYIPVRRTALYIEESLFRGLQWAVFEPNDEELWSQIRLNVNAFMQTLYRRGAFQGATPMQAFFVKCDRDTNPQENIDQGIVTVQVGFAPLKPAEFVIVQISQKTGQTA